MGVRGASPFNGSGTAARPRSSSKIIAPNRVPLVFGTNSGSINEPPIRCSFFCGERGGDRSIGEANLRKGAALQWKRHCRPLQWKRHRRPPSHAGFASSLRGISHVRLAYLAPCFVAVLPLAGRLMGGQKGKCLGVAQYCVDYENSEYYCGNRRPAEEFGEEVRYRKNREENHRERVLREGFSQVAAQQRMEGAQGSASRAVEACQRVCRARRKNRRR